MSMATQDYTSKCLKPNSAAIPDQIKTQYGRINTNRNSVQKKSGHTDKTTVHLANDNPTENYDWQ